MSVHVTTIGVALSACKRLLCVCGGVGVCVRGCVSLSIYVCGELVVPTQVCDDSQRQLLMARITAHLNQLKKLTYGKHIVARVEKLLVAGNAAAVQQVRPKDSIAVMSASRVLCAVS